MTLQEAIENNKTILLSSIKTLVAIPSVCTVGSKEKLVGEEIDKALDTVLEIAKSFGCVDSKKDSEGLYAYAEWGSGVEMLGILAHVDVVPANNPHQWHTPPFEAIEKDGELYGRGTSDDKGPLLACMIALKSLQDIGFKPKKRIRFIIGGDEETGMRCMASYKKKEEIPTLAFTPDGAFPLIYGEKGIIHIEATTKQFHGVITAGSARNAVAGVATYEGKNHEEIYGILKEMGASVQQEKGILTIEGVSAHAKDPEKGINALIQLAEALYAAGDKSPIVQFIKEALGITHNGEKILGIVKDKESGSLTITPSMIKTVSNEMVLTLDIRVPITVDTKSIEEKLVEAMQQYGLRTNVLENKPALYAPLDTLLVQGLLKAYQEVTKDTLTKPITTGGGTYARMFHDRCVAFGMVFAAEDATFHQDNEHISIEKLMQATHIYARAIQNLAG